MMRTGFYLTLFLLFGGVSGLMAQDLDPDSDPDVQPNSPTYMKGYELTWSDEFNGTAVDEGKWIYREGDDSRTFVKSYQTADNNGVSNGLYRCILKKESKGTKEFTAGGIISSKKMRYGYYESSFKCPPTGGWHTSFWMMSRNGGDPSIELDVFENDSVDLSDYSVNVHRWKPDPHVTFGTKNVVTLDLSADFHVLGCEYTPEYVRYFFDGELVQEVDATQFDHNDMNVWLTSLGLVYDWQPAIDESQLPVEAQYDYVRFFELGPYATAEITSPDSGGATLTDTNTTVALEATVTTFLTNAAPTVLWSKIAGPGDVLFTDAASTNTGARFSAAGAYELECSAIFGTVTNSDSVLISVNVPQIITLQHGVADVQNPCTFIRADLPDRNNGSDDEMIVGTWGGGSARGLMSFDLSGLDPDAVIQDVQLDLYNYGGEGSVGTVELRELYGSFEEGVGNGDSDANGAGTGATWYQRTGSNFWVNVTTASGMVEGFASVSSVSGDSGSDYVYLETKTDPGTATGVLTDERIDTGLLNTADNSEYHVDETLTADHVITVIYNGSTGAYYDQPGTVTAYDSSGAQVGSSVSIPDLESSSYTSMNLARPSDGTLLSGRSVFGFVLPVVDFGGTASEIAYIQMTGTPDVNQCDMHYVGTATADSSVLSAGVQAITAASEHASAPENWTVDGGDFSSTVLSSLSGYDATVAGYKTFGSSTAFALLAQEALEFGDPLNLMIYSSTTSNGNIARFRSDDATSANERPMLTISYLGSYLPEIYAGENLGGMTNSPVILSGSATHVDSVNWSVVSGPGAVLFSDTSALTNSASFAAPGRYWLRLSGANELGSGFRDISVSIVDDRPVFNSGVIVDDTYIFEISAVTGLTYTMQASTNLQGNWMDLYTTNAVAEPMILEAPISTNGTGFYRLILEP